MPFTKIELPPEVFATCEKMARVMTRGDVDKFLSGFIIASMTSLKTAIDSNVDIKDVDIVLNFDEL